VKLFWRLFLSFWLATVLMMATVLTVSEYLPATLSHEYGRNVLPEVGLPALRAAVDTFEREGTEAFRLQVRNSTVLRHSGLALFDEHAELVAASLRASGPYLSLAADVAGSGRVELYRVGLRTLYACPVESATGKHYIAVLTIIGPGSRMLTPRFWLNYGLAMIAVAGVCLLLSLYLTRPIARLQLASRRLAQGDLTARAGPLSLNRSDELGDLGRDFDAMAAQIESLMTAQRRFVADVSHELGGPLTRMHLALALLRREIASTQSGALIRIERETDKLSNLVQQLLLLASLEAGRVPAESLVSLSLSSLCESIVEDANFEAAHAGCRVIGSRQDVKVAAYPNLLRSAIDNIMRNALRYAPPGSEVELNAGLDPGTGEAVVEVLDQGPGVPEAMLRDIFAPFFRTAPGREASTGGAGLGLSIASEAMRLHHGTISATNRPGGGLRVAMRFPQQPRSPVGDD
jgi:two-component system, OmpR family, sensor histidine kinase CpxA